MPYRAVPLSVLLTLVAIAPPSSARATTFADVSVEQLAQASDLVVLGRVERVDVHPTGPAGQPGIHTRAVIQVAETLRGEHRPFVEVWVHGGRLGNRMRVVPGQATFRVGEEAVVFLFESGGAHWPTGMARGKWPVERRDHDDTGITVPGGITFDGCAQPSVSLTALARTVARSR